MSAVTLSSPQATLPLLALCGAQFLLTMDIVILHLALPDLQRVMALDARALQAVNVAYLAAFAACLLPAGGLADRLGAARLFRAGAAVLAAGSLLGAVGHGYGTVLLARVFQGVGGGMLLPAALSLLGESFPAGPARERATGWWSLAAVLGAVAGMLLGGIGAAAGGWRAAFWLAFVLAAPLAGAIPVGAEPPRGRLAGFDLGGSLLVAGGIGLLVVGFGLEPQAGSRTAWAALGLGAGLLAAFAIRSARGARPLLRFTALRHAGFVAALLAAMVHGAGPQGAMFFLSLELQAGAGWSAPAVGIALLPPALAAPLGVLLAVRLVRRAGAMATLALGLAAMGAALAGLGQLPAQPDYPRDVLPGLLVLGIGATLTAVPMYLLALADGEAETLGARTGLLYTAQYLGPALLLQAMTWAGGGHGAATANLTTAFALGAVCLLATAGTVLLLLATVRRESSRRSAQPPGSR